jgi:hypothetical protein
MRHIQTGAHGGCRGLLPGCRFPPNRILKNTDFVDLISNILRDLLFSQNQPPKLADDCYLRIFKNEIKT